MDIMTNKKVFYKVTISNIKLMKKCQIEVGDKYVGTISIIALFKILK